MKQNTTIENHFSKIGQQQIVKQEKNVCTACINYIHLEQK